MSPPASDGTDHVAAPETLSPRNLLTLARLNTLIGQRVFVSITKAAAALFPIASDKSVISSFLVYL
jgi:hypothetical protein